MGTLIEKKSVMGRFRNMSTRYPSLIFTDGFRCFSDSFFVFSEQLQNVFIEKESEIYICNPHVLTFKQKLVISYVVSW